MKVARPGGQMVCTRFQGCRGHFLTSPRPAHYTYKCAAEHHATRKEPRLNNQSLTHGVPPTASSNSTTPALATTFSAPGRDFGVSQMRLQSLFQSRGLKARRAARDSSRPKREGDSAALRDKTHSLNKRKAPDYRRFLLSNSMQHFRITLLTT